MMLLRSLVTIIKRPGDVWSLERRTEGTCELRLLWKTHGSPEIIPVRGVSLIHETEIRLLTQEEIFLWNATIAHEKIAVVALQAMEDKKSFYAKMFEFFEYCKNL